jgi:hypothetical protein
MDIEQKNLLDIFDHETLDAMNISPIKQKPKSPTESIKSPKESIKSPKESIKSINESIKSINQVNSIDISDIFTHTVIKNYREKKLTCLNDQIQKETLDYSLALGFNSIADLFKEYEGNADNWIAYQTSKKTVPFSERPGVNIYYSSIIEKRQMPEMAMFFLDIKQAKLKSQYDFINKIINLDESELKDMSKFYPRVYGFRIPKELNLLDVNEKFIYLLENEIHNLTKPVSIYSIICSLVSNSYDGIKANNVIVLCKNVREYSEEKTTFIYESEYIKKTTNISALLEDEKYNLLYLKEYLDYPNIRLNYLDNIYPYYRSELELCMQNYSQNELDEMYKNISDYAMSRITTALRVEIYTMIISIREMIKNCAEIVIAGAEAINFSFDEYDRDISTDIDTKLVPLFNLTVKNWKEYIVFLIKFKNYFWYDVLDKILAEWNNRYINYIYSYMIQLEGLLGFMGIKFYPTPFEKNSLKPFSKRFTPMYKTGYVDNGQGGISHGMIYDVMLYSIDFNFKLYLPMTSSNFFEAEDDSSSQYYPQLQLQEFSYGVLDIPIVTNSFLTNTKIVENISNYNISANNPQEGIVINPEMNKYEFDDLLKILSQQLYFVSKTYSSHDIERLVKSNSRPEKLEKDKSRLKKIENAPIPSGVYGKIDYKNIEKCNTRTDCSNRCNYNFTIPSYMSSEKKLDIYSINYITFGSIFKTFYYITPSSVLLNSIDDLKLALYNEIPNEYTSISPLKEIETNLVYDDTVFTYYQCSDTNLCDFVTERRDTHKYKMDINFFKLFKRPYTWVLILLPKLLDFIYEYRAEKGDKETLAQLIYGFNIDKDSKEYAQISECEMALNILQIVSNLNKMQYYRYKDLYSQSVCIKKSQLLIKYLLNFCS